MHHFNITDIQLQISFCYLSNSVKAVTDGKYIVMQTVLQTKQEVKVIWQTVPHGGPIPRLGVTPGGRNLYHWITGVGVPISVQ